jgi:hypothetical protein
MFFALPQLATAQQGTVEEIPPRLEKLEEGQPPSAGSHRTQVDARITEQRERGQVTSIEVQNGSSTYYLKPNMPAGSAFSSDTQMPSTRGAQWQIFEFDWNREPKKNRGAAAHAKTIAPPPALATPPQN